MAKKEHVHDYALMKMGGQSVVACSTCGKLKNRIGSIDVKKAKKAFPEMKSDNPKKKTSKSKKK